MVIGQRTLGLCRPIRIYVKGRHRCDDRYLCTTRSAKNLREAKQRLAAQSGSFYADELRAVYADTY